MKTRKIYAGTKERCPKGTKRYAPVGPDCYTQEYIDEWQNARKDKNNRRKKDQKDLENNLKNNLENNLENNLDKDLDKDIENNLEKDLDKDLETNLDKDIENNLEKDLDKDLETNLDKDIETNLDKDLETNLDKDLDNNLDKDLDENMNQVQAPIAEIIEEPIIEDSIPTITEAEFKNYRLYKSPSPKADIWELRNPLYFDNPPRKFIFDKFLFTIMEKQTNKTHLKYIRTPVVNPDEKQVEVPVVNPNGTIETHHVTNPVENPNGTIETHHVANPVENPVINPIEEEPLTYVPQKTNAGELTLDYKNRDGSITKLSDNSDFLYPTYDDPYFSSKIAQRQEFQDYKYDGTVTDIEKMSNKLCENAEFSLMPHQLFVKNFLSKNTPYNSILLYHGLGSGKTCSAIGIAEEARATMKQTGSTQRILMIASSNVQDNFKLQLFDERKLKRVLNNGAWTIESCIGNSLIKEINPTGDPDIKAERIVAQANAIINSSYSFMGYMQLANFIQYKILKPAESDLYNATQKKQIEIANIKKYFNNRLVIIDEVHNISTKTVAPLLLMVAKHAENLRFVLMSATPMYNSVEEIIYLTNLMNINDGRPAITVGQVFDANGQMADKGKMLLQNKLNGYISYVRGENPYTFPFRLYPDVFDPLNTFMQKTYPTKSITGRDNLPVMKGMKDRIFLTNAGEKQREIYDFIAAHSFQSNSQRNIFKSAAEDDDTALFNNMETFGYTKLQIPIQALIMTFPQKLDTEDVDDIGAFCKTMVGKDGMARAMKFKEERKKLDEETSIYMKHQYEYKKGFEGLFSLQGSLRLYSGKIAAICEKILTSTGIVMVYSQYIDGGIVPMALALEELGFARYGSMQQYVKPLFKKGAAINQEPRDAITMELRPDFLKSRGGDGFKQAKYMILSGDKFFSQNNAEDIKYATNKANASGEQIRVILISRAASEGLDFKFIRQVHILDPWYNMNRVEQIVGRGVRNLSHCGLPFSERNVEIYMHATSGDTKEYADHYVYRYAENKAITIGKVTRLMKQISVDCVLNIGQNNFTVDELFKIAENKQIRVHPSSIKETISFRVGDKSGTDACDYADSCDYVCLKDNGNKDTIRETFDKSTLEANSQRPIDKIKALFKTQKTVYHKDELAKYVQNDTQLNYVLTQLIEDPLETVEDMFGRQGRVVNRGPFYLYQPIEVTDRRSNAIENTNPVNFKHDVLSYAISDTLPKDDEANTIVQEADGSVSPVSPTDANIMEKGAEQILDELETKYDIIVDPVAANLSAGETEWHIIYNSERGGKSLIQDYLIKDLGLTREEADIHAFTHMCDVLHYREKRILIEYLYTNKQASDTAFLKQLRAYFDARKLEKAKSFGFLLSRITKGIIKNVFLLYENGKWMEEEPGDMVSYKQDIYDMLKKDVSLLNPILGFMGYFKGRGTTWSMVFKTKILSMGKNNKGAYLQNEGKAEILKKFNSIVKTKTYTMAEVEELSKIGLALVLEMAMRHLNTQGTTKYVLTAEEALFNGVEGL